MTANFGLRISRGGEKLACDLQQAGALRCDINEVLMNLLVRVDKAIAHKTAHRIRLHTVKLKSWEDSTCSLDGAWSFCPYPCTSHEFGFPGTRQADRDVDIAKQVCPCNTLTMSCDALSKLQSQFKPMRGCCQGTKHTENTTTSSSQTLWRLGREL